MSAAAQFDVNVRIHVLTEAKNVFLERVDVRQVLLFESDHCEFDFDMKSLVNPELWDFHLLVNSLEGLQILLSSLVV